MRHLPKHQRFKCRECDQTKHGNYFLSETLCKKCGAKRRSPNVPVNLSDFIVVTSNVERRIRKSANSAVPISIKYLLSAKAFYLTLFAVWGTGLGYTFSSAPMTESNGLRWVIGLGVFFGGVILGNWVEEKSKGPKLERAKQVDATVLDFAVERADQISEREQFYASAEWKMVRDIVINEEGRICRECGRRINKDIDVTVDHILPRRRHPELALIRSNLTVLCRSCNSAKGDRE